MFWLGLPLTITQSTNYAKAPVSTNDSTPLNTANTRVKNAASKNEAASAIATAAGIEPGLPYKPNAIPSYRVTDDSRIDISVVESSKTESLVKNNFHDTSSELKTSLGIGGYGIGVTGGVSTKTQTGHGLTGKTLNRKMIGKYQVSGKRIHVVLLKILMNH